jgi:hypothetical protein
MSKHKNQVNDQDSSIYLAINDQNAPQSLIKSKENSIDYTTNNGDFAQISHSENMANFAKTVDPVSDFSDFENGEERKISFSLEEDNLLLQRLFPGVLRENVENDEACKLFSRFAPKSTPFASIYSDYLALVDKISDSAIKKHLVNEQNKRASAGSLASSSNQSEFYSKEQVLKMSREQISKNYDKIRKSQEKW